MAAPLTHTGTPPPALSDHFAAAGGSQALDNRVDILVVDDLPDKLLVYQTILEELGQNLITARSGEEALKLVLQREFAVILLDVNMPGMDGFETASFIRQRKKSAHTPIIFLTSFTDDMRAAQGYASGAVDYIPLPVVPAVLQAKVKVFIELSQMRRQAALQAEDRVRRAIAEEAARKAEFLSHMSETLARAQTQNETLHAAASAPLDYFAHFALAHLSHEETGKSRYVWAGRQNAAPQESADAPPMPWLEQALKKAVVTGQTQVFPRLSFFAEAQAEAAETALACAIIVPMAVHGKTCGALTFARQAGEREFSHDDVALALDLVSRTGIALEKIILMEQIQEADKRKDEFLGMLAHELRNPLGPIRNAVQLMHMSGPKAPPIEQVRDIIDRQVSHMAHLIDDLLDATRLARGQILLRKEPCDLRALVRQTAEDYRSIFDKNGIAFDVNMPDAPVWMTGDPTRLVQAVGNLLHNAHKFTPGGGKVDLILEHNEAAHEAVLRVRDNGIGIEPSMLPHIFDVFRQGEQGLDRSRGGLGLGLTLVRGLVFLHQGEVTARSEGTGKGAEIIIRLPAQAPVAEIIPFPAGDIGTGVSYRILIIEDNRDTAESARMLLQLEGHEVNIALSGPEGIGAAGAFRPHFILCDIGLPGMDGYQVARAIRATPELSNTYMIALTGYGREEDQRKAREAGFNRHLTKPLDYAQLTRSLTLPTL